MPMTNSSFDFYQEKDRLKLMQPPKLSEPNKHQHNKYASDSNINDALVMLEPGLRKMAKDGYMTTSSCTDTQTDEIVKSALGSSLASSPQASVTCRVSVDGNDHIYHYIDGTDPENDYNKKVIEDKENFYEIPIEKHLKLKIYGSPAVQNSRKSSFEDEQSSGKLVEPGQLDSESGFYSYTTCDEGKDIDQEQLHYLQKPSLLDQFKHDQLSQRIRKCEDTHKETKWDFNFDCEHVKGPEHIT